MRLLPWSYGVRNLARAPVRSALSVGGSALVVLLVLAAASSVRGLSTSVELSGDPDNVLLLGAGSETSLERSEIEPGVAGIAEASIDGVRERLGTPYVSPEIHLASHVHLAGSEEGRMAILRGITPRAYLVHRSFRLVEGRPPRSGEAIAGRLAATRMGLAEEDLGTGRTIRLDRTTWTIAGRFEAPRSVLEAEIWVPLADLRAAAQRDQLSTVVVGLGDADFADVDLFTKERLDLGLVPMREVDYYRDLAAFYRPVRQMIWLTAILVSAGGLFGGLNTMYAAFASRVRELATLRAIGFGRVAIALSLVQESVLASAAGGILASGLGVLVLDGRAVRFSMGAFRLVVDGPVLLVGLAVALGLGLVGALPPAWRALRLPLPIALKTT